MLNQNAEEKPQDEKPRIPAYFLEEGARLYLSLKDKNQNDCYYMIAHEANNKYLGIPHHETNVYRCSMEDTVGKTVFQHGDEPVWIGGVKANESGEIEKYYTGVCLVKSQAEGHFPYGTTAEDIKSLGAYAYLIPKGFGESKCEQNETMSDEAQSETTFVKEQLDIEQVLSQEE